MRRFLSRGDHRVIEESEAAKFLAYMHSDAAKPFFTKQGFSVLTK